MRNSVVRSLKNRKEPKSSKLSKSIQFQNNDKKTHLEKSARPKFKIRNSQYTNKSLFGQMRLNPKGSTKKPSTDQ
jgi:hypothetical protein